MLRWKIHAGIIKFKTQPYQKTGHSRYSTSQFYRRKEQAGLANRYNMFDSDTCLEWRALFRNRKHPRKQYFAIRHHLQNLNYYKQQNTIGSKKLQESKLVSKQVCVNLFAGFIVDCKTTVWGPRPLTANLSVSVVHFSLLLRSTALKIDVSFNQATS